MKKSALKSFIREEVINTLSEETIIATQSGTSSDATSDQKQQASKLTSKGETVKFVKKGQAIKEMARTSNNVKVGNIDKFEKAQKIYGDTWVGKMLQAIKDAGDNGLSQNELVSIAGKKAFAEINPTIKEFVTIGVLSKTREKTVEKPKDEEPETPESSIEEPKQEKPDSEYFINDKDEEAPVEKTEEPESKEEEPPVAAIKGAEKEVGGKTYAKKLSPEDEDKYARIKKGIESKVKKLQDMTKAKRTESDDLKLLKQLIARDDVKKLFKAKGVSIKDIVSGVIS